MGEIDYNALLYDKMKAEQDKYRDWLLNQPPEEILNHTYEYTMREDIVMCMEELELSPKQAKALLRSPCPLDDVYKEFRDREVEHKLSAMFGRMSKEMAQDTKKLSAMQAELQGAKGHLKNMGLLFIGKAAKEAEHSKTDKGVLSKLSRLFEKAQKGFASLEQKAMDMADKLRVSRVKSSVKENLNKYKAQAAKQKEATYAEPTVSKDENRTAQAVGQINVPHPQKSNPSKER